MERSMTNEIRMHLLECIDPFWKKMIDKERGGYCGYLDFALQAHREADKGVILNSRILWYFSNKYLLFHEREDLYYAEHAYKFLVEQCLDPEYGGVFWMLDYQGKVKDTMKHTYNQAFAIYALSSYYDACKDEEIIQYALELFELIEKKCVDEYGYLEAFDREWNKISNEKLSDNKKLLAIGIVAEKTMNTLLHVMEAYTELYRVSGEARVKDRLIHILFIIEEKVYNRETHVLGEYFNRRLECVVDTHSYGHDIEAAWLLDRAADLLGDCPLQQRIAKMSQEIVDQVLDVGFYHGALNNERFLSEIDCTRIWWVQAEAVVGLVNAYQKTQDKHYLNIANELWNYIKEYLIDKREGSEWYWEVDYNGKANTEKPLVEPWKCPYHNGRMCLEIIRRMGHV